MDSTSSRLVEFVQRAPRMLSPAAVEACKRSLVDSFACAFGAFDDPLSVKAREIAGRQHATPGATVLGTTKTTTIEAATFANGVMIRLDDSNDSYMSKSRGHPSDATAAVLAVAEAVNASGAQFIEAVNIAYEVFCSFCDAVDINSKGWDQPIYAGLGAVMGAAKLLRLTPEETGHALALALAPNMTLRQTREGELSSWKGCAGANAARNAVFAAYLAKDGFSGPPAVFEGKGGLWDAVGRFDWTIPESDPPKVAQVHMKCFSFAYPGQSAGWAALDAKKKLGTHGVESIKAVKVETFQQAIAVMASDPVHWAPHNVESADHSIPYVVSVALLDGNISSDSFEMERIMRADARALMKKIEVKEDLELSRAYPKELPCRLTITFASGEELTTMVRQPKGHVAAPLDNAEIETKFRNMFRGYGPDEQREAILDKLWKLDKLERVNDLIGACAKR